MIIFTMCLEFNGKYNAVLHVACCLLSLARHAFLRILVFFFQFSFFCPYLYQGPLLMIKSTRFQVHGRTHVSKPFVETARPRYTKLYSHIYSSLTLMSFALAVPQYSKWSNGNVTVNTQCYPPEHGKVFRIVLELNDEFWISYLHNDREQCNDHWNRAGKLTVVLPVYG